jgi:ribosome-associated protein
LRDGTEAAQDGTDGEVVAETVREEADDRPWHVEGSQQSEWILMDYVSTVIHLFQREARAFYDLDGLWADGVKIELPKQYLIDPV